MKTFKNKQGTIYIDVTKNKVEKFNICVYDFIQRRDVLKNTGLSETEAIKILEELKNKYDCHLEL